MTASLVRSEGRTSTWWREPQQLALYGSFLTAVIAFIADYLGTPLLYVNILYFLAVLIGVYYPARKALIALRNMTPTIHLLMLIGSVGAMALGLWGEAAVLIVVYSLGDVLESYAVDKARGAIRSLMALVPKEALVRRNGCEIGLRRRDDRRRRDRDRPAGRADPGRRHGRRRVVVRRPGRRHGRARARSTAAPARTSSPGPSTRTARSRSGSRSRRPRRCSRGSSSRSRRRRRNGRRTSGSRTPSGSGTRRPCSSSACSWPPSRRSSSAPTGTSSSTAGSWSSWSPARAASPSRSRWRSSARWRTPRRTARSSRAASYLEVVDTVKVVAFDKTGTLTIGRPAVTDVVTFGDLSEDALLDLAGCIESRSGHPLAAAIVRKARESGTFSGDRPREFEETAGRGVAATVDGQACRIGSPRALARAGGRDRQGGGSDRAARGRGADRGPGQPRRPARGSHRDRRRGPDRRGRGPAAALAVPASGP